MRAAPRGSGGSPIIAGRPKQTARCGSKPNATVSSTRRSARRPVCGSAILISARVVSSVTSTAEFAPSNRRLVDVDRRSAARCGATRSHRARCRRPPAARKPRRHRPSRRVHSPAPHPQTAGGLDLDRIGVDADGLSRDAIVRADEACDERRRRLGNRAPAACPPARSARHSSRRRDRTARAPPTGRA